MVVTTRRIGAIVGELVVVGVAAAVAYVLLPPRQTAEVAEPGHGATPEQVVAAYLEALNAHDCDTAAALTTGQDVARAWCGDVAELGDVEIGDHAVESPAWSGRPAGTEVVRVPVSFELDWRLLHSDGSMDEGPTDWGFLLTRAAPDAPWRIFDQGVG